MKISRTPFGYTVKFNCPKCKEGLVASLNDAGSVDQCPDCLANFIVPGKSQLATITEEHRRARAERQQNKLLRKERKVALRAKKKEKLFDSSSNEAVVERRGSDVVPLPPPAISHKAGLSEQKTIDGTNQVLSPSPSNTFTCAMVLAVAGGFLMLACGGCFGLYFIGSYQMTIEKAEADQRAATYRGPYFNCSTVVWSYNSNEADADRVYKDNFSGYKGIVKRISSTYLVIEGGQGEFGDNCVVYDLDSASLSGLTKGEEVKFYGRCDGYWIGNVIFRDATIK